MLASELHSSKSASNNLADRWLAQRLASAESPPVRLKALELILSLRQRGSKEMQAALASGCGAAVELSTQFRCEPHPERGDLPQEMVQLKAAECLARLQGKKWKAPKKKKAEKKKEYVPREYAVELGPPGLVVQSGELLLEVPKGGIRKAGFKCSPGLYVIAVNPVRPLCTALLAQLCLP